MALITLNEYADRNGRRPATVRQKVYRGGFKTIQKIGRQLFIDENEPYVDERMTSGEYVGFREGYAGWKHIQNERKREKPPADEAASGRAEKAKRHEQRKAILDTVRDLGITIDEAVDLIKK